MSFRRLSPLVPDYLGGVVVGAVLGAFLFSLVCLPLEGIEWLLSSYVAIDFSTWGSMAMVGVFTLWLMRSLETCVHPHYLDQQVFVMDTMFFLCFFIAGRAIVAMFADLNFSAAWWMALTPGIFLIWFAVIMLLSNKDVITPNLPQGNSTT